MRGSEGVACGSIVVQYSYTLIACYLYMYAYKRRKREGGTWTLRDLQVRKHRCLGRDKMYFSMQP